MTDFVHLIFVERVETRVVRNTAQRDLASQGQILRT